MLKWYFMYVSLGFASFIQSLFFYPLEALKIIAPYLVGSLLAWDFNILEWEWYAGLPLILPLIFKFLTIIPAYLGFFVYFSCALFLCPIYPTEYYTWYDGIWHGVNFIPNYLLSLMSDNIHYKAIIYSSLYNISWWASLILSVVWYMLVMSLINLIFYLITSIFYSIEMYIREKTS